LTIGPRPSIPSKARSKACAPRTSTACYIRAAALKVILVRSACVWTSAMIFISTAALTTTYASRLARIFGSERKRSELRPRTRRRRGAPTLLAHPCFGLDPTIGQGRAHAVRHKLMVRLSVLHGRSNQLLFVPSKRAATIPLPCAILCIELKCHLNTDLRDT